MYIVSLILLLYKAFDSILYTKYARTVFGKSFNENSLHREIKNMLYLKVVSATCLLVCFSSLKDSTWETRKNVFHFTSKALFVLKKIKF